MIIIQLHIDNTSIFHHFNIIFFICRTRFHFNPKPNDGGLFICCGQLVGKKGGPRHMSCPGTNSGYRVGGLFLEMECCPFARCTAMLTDPESNISHQDEVHRSIKTWMCPICEINFVSEGCVMRHILPFTVVPRAMRKI